jgi:hypothetical protein
MLLAKKQDVSVTRQDYDIPKRNPFSGPAIVRPKLLEECGASPGVTDQIHTIARRASAECRHHHGAAQY